MPQYSLSKQAGEETMSDFVPATHNNRLTQQRIRSAWLFLTPMLVLLGFGGWMATAAYYLVQFHGRQFF